MYDYLIAGPELIPSGKDHAREKGGRLERAADPLSVLSRETPRAQPPSASGGCKKESNKPG